MSDFRKLRVWQAARELAINSDKAARRMRGTRSIPIRNQFVRAAMSVAANIIEGSAHESPREFARYLRYALASASETEGHAQLACDVGLMTDETYESIVKNVVDVRMMLHGLLKKLETAP